MNAAGILQMVEEVIDATVRVSIAWAMIAVGIFFLAGAIVNLDDWRERKRENARYRR